MIPLQHSAVQVEVRSDFATARQQQRTMHVRPLIVREVTTGERLQFAIARCPRVLWVGHIDVGAHGSQMPVSSAYTLLLGLSSDGSTLRRGL